jgi:hypothetical protein
MESKVTKKRMLELFNGLKDERKRRPVKQSILKKVYTELNKLEKIPYKKKNWENLFWGENPNKENSLIIDLPLIEVDDMTYNVDFTKKPIYYDEERIKKEGIKYINKSCVITHKGEIVLVYITEEYDRAITKATEKLLILGEGMNKYYPVKDHTFYTRFKFAKKDANEEEKKEVYNFNKQQQKEDRYTGKNWMDGMIRYYLGLKNNKGGTLISYQPRKLEADEDDEFMFALVYSFCALYSLEKRYAPAVAKYRYDLAKDAGFVGAFPNVPLERHCATGVGGSYDFSSSLHNDSGMSGLTETIFWNKCKKGEHQLFISPAIKLVFDLSNKNAIILQPPKIPHGTASTGNHNGYGFVNITKQNLVAKTDITKNYYDIWKKYLNQ